MTDSAVKIIVDCSNGEVQELPLTAEEIAQREAQALIAAQEQAEREAAEAQKAQDREDAIATLTGLGLTEAQITALLS